MSVSRRSLLAWAAAGAVPERPRASALDELFDTARRIPRLTSLTVYRRGKLVRELFQNGLADDRALTNVKSIAKPILSILVGIALDRCDVRSVDDPVARYLPEKLTAASGLQHLTIRHLLTMTADVVKDWGEVGASANWLDHIVAKGSTGTLGQFRYSTPATHLLAAALERATGVPALDYARRHLFGPLGITEVVWDTDPQGHHRGGNDIHLGTRDLARLGQLMLDGGRHRGRRIVSAQWVRASTRKQVEITDAEADPVGKLALDGYGYLWWTMKLGGHDAHLGWGYGRQYLIVVPAVRVVVTLTSLYDVAGPEEHHRAIVSLIETGIGPLLA